MTPIGPSGSLLVVTGPPGAGKSTVARVLVERSEPSVLVEGDRFFAFLARGAVDPWLSPSEAQNAVVGDAAGAATGIFVRGGFATVYDGVVGPWSLPRFLAAAELGHLDYLVLLPSVAQCVAQVAGRRDHGFTDEAATRKMHHQFATAALDPRHVLADPPADVAVVADRIVSARARCDLRVLAP